MPVTQLRHALQKVLRPGAFAGENGLAEFSKSQVARLADNTNAMCAAGIVIPVCAEENERHPTRLHESMASPTDDPLYRGRVIAAFVQDDWLRLLCDLTNAEHPTDMRSSAWIEPAVTAAGQTFSPGLRHLLLTRDPAVPDQGPAVFLRMSRGSTDPLSTVLSDDRILLERFKTHRASPHTFPHPGHRLRLEGLLAVESAGFLGSSILAPPVKQIPPDD